MAIFKAVKTTAGLKGSIEYATDKATIIRGKDCSDDPEKAYDQMMAVKELYDKTDGKQFYHYSLNFKPGEVAIEKAMEIAMQIAEKKFPGHEVLLAAHQDKKHWHVHIIANSVNFENGLKLQIGPPDLQKIKDFSDQLCKQNGLSVIDKNQPKEPYKLRTYNKNKYQAITKGGSDIDNTRMALTRSLEKSTDKVSLINNMYAEGYRTDWSDNKKHITFTAINNDKMKFRADSLAETFGVDKLSKVGIIAQLEINQRLQNQVGYRQADNKPLNKAETKYIEYSKRGLNDKQAASVMIRTDKLDKSAVGNAIGSFSTSSSCPTLSTEARKWGNGIAEGVVKMDSKAVALSATMAHDNGNIDWGALTAEQAQEKIAELARKGLDR